MRMYGPCVQINSFSAMSIHLTEEIKDFDKHEIKLNLRTEEVHMARKITNQGGFKIIYLCKGM